MTDVVRLPHLLLADVEVEGWRRDVHVGGGRVLAIGEQLPRPAGADVRHGGGAALLPGLHDHHVHLLATAAARTSVPCGPPEVADLAGLRRALRAAPADRAVRGTGYHGSVAGPLDRVLLDELVPDRPARVQDRSGGLWTLNARALAEAGLPVTGDGRLWRGHPALRAPTRPDEDWPDLAALGDELAGLGVLGVSDATPDTSRAAAARIAAADLPQQVLLMGAGQDPAAGTPAPRKVLLADEDDLDWQALLALVRDTHALGRPVAVHTVTRASLVAVLSVLEVAGALPGDRLEHAAVVPPELVGLIARLGLSVVTQPALAAARGDDYLRDVEPCDRDDLWPYASLLAAGIAVAPSSDAPYGPVDPWAVLRQARDRRTPAGAVLRPLERVTVRQALDGLLSPLEHPGGPPRRVAVGAPADLVLLDVPLGEAMREPSCERVALVVAAR